VEGESLATVAAGPKPEIDVLLAVAAVARVPGASITAGNIDNVRTRANTFTKCERAILPPGVSE
jgi:hypothetical protein